MKVKSDAIMEVEKKHSRGGFFHLFDWNSNSRKKLFSNNAEISGESKRGKPVESLLKSSPCSIDGDEYYGTSSNTCSADFSSASSVTSDEGCGSRAPGVVARLMGLDSLPTLNVLELSSTAYSSSCSLRVSHYERSTPNLRNEYQPMDYTDISNKRDRSSPSPIEPKFHKVQNRPIERFQTEILPPKSAKPTPITNHKLLSPVKRPGFIPSKNAAYIMEAAAKIVEVSPQTTSKHKVPSLAFSSVPLKIRDLKAKIEAAHEVSRPQRPEEPSQSVAESLKEQHKGKCHNKSDSDKCSSNSSRNKGKSVSLAEQARVNVRRKEGSFSSGNVSPANPKEGNDAKGKHFSRRQADMRKNAENRTSTNRTDNVLRHNNQKQNCISNRDHLTSKTSTVDQQGRKARSANGTVGLNRTINKVTVNPESQCRNMSSSATGSSKELPMSRRKNLSRKKQPVNEELQSGKTVSENSSMNERSIKCNVTTTDGHSNQDAEKMKTSIDVVLFTFTSPIKRSMPEVPSTSQVAETSCSFDSDPSGDSDLFSKSSGFSSLGLGIIGGEALSDVLGKKLHELTYRVESSNCNIILEETSCSAASSRKTSVLPSGALTTTSMGNCKRLQVDLEKDVSHSLANFNCSAIDNLELDWRRKWQLSEEIEDQNASNSSSETGIELDLQHPSPISTLELRVMSECFADSRDGSSGMMHLAPDEEVLSLSPGTESSQTMGETEEKLLTAASNSTDFKESTNSELDYVKLVIKDSELKFIEYALGRTNNIMTPNASDQLEHHGEGHNNLELKLLLDCMSESLELRYGQVLVGSCKGWAKWGELIQNEGWLAEELYKEILGWRNMGNILVVDDLVAKNMNTKHERWLDFDMEAFEEGLEVEKTILTCLVDELVFDLLL